MKTTSKLITLLMIITMTCSCGNPKKKAETITSDTDSTEVDWML